MHFYFTNVNDAFEKLVEGIQRGAIRCRQSTSRVGDVLQIEDPVIITYLKPTQRVLFNQARDANPFFHVYESLWMLAGRRDIAPLDYYSSGYSKEVRDGDSPYANGAYGYRWRKAGPLQWDLVGEGDDAVPVMKSGAKPTSTDEEGEPRIDQLKIIVDQLKEKPADRRCVLAMWNVEDDLLKINTSKDVCCNTHAYFLLRDRGAPWPAMEGSPRYLLDMTVCNRSNDLVWGALGANVVHFSFLQEYLAARLGVEVGLYHQITNNLHVYRHRWYPEEWLAEYQRTQHSAPRIDYASMWKHVPLVAYPDAFDGQCTTFVEMNKNAEEVTQTARYTEPFIDTVARPMCLAFHMYKAKDFDAALHWVEKIEDSAWRIVSRNWIEKRKANWLAKKGEQST